LLRFLTLLLTLFVLPALTQAMSEAAEGMEEALALPCFGDTVANEFNSQGTASGFTQTQASAWGAVPEGCWGKEVTASGGQAPTLTGPSKLDGYYNQGEIDYGACAFPSGSDQRVANACCAEVRMITGVSDGGMASEKRICMNERKKKEGTKT